jgi:hypothetical protein
MINENFDKHNPFCSVRGSWPCSIGCETWPKCAAEMFPRLIGACPSICPVHGKDVVEKDGY